MAIQSFRKISIKIEPQAAFALIKSAALPLFGFFTIMQKSFQGEPNKGPTSEMLRFFWILGVWSSFENPKSIAIAKVHKCCYQFPEC